MSAQVVPPSESSPFWKVQAVFDPDGGGGDFAYTIGMDSVRLPELHLWARPARGEDPAPDWKFSSRDLGALLNEFAGMQLRGDLAVGSVVERTFDGGMARVRFEVDPPGERAALEAFGIARGAVILPIRWSLGRVPVGESRDLDEGTRADVRMEYARLAQQLSPLGLPPGWKLYKRPRFTPQQRFGPLTALVHVRAIGIAQAGPEPIREFVELAMCARRIGALGQVVALASAAARGCGRVAAVESVIEESSRLASWLVFEDGLACSEALKLFTGDLEPEDALGQHQAAHALRDLLTVAVTATLTTQVVADVASDDALLMGMGPWLAAASDTGMSPGGRWHAAPSVVAQVEAVLRSGSGSTLTDLIASHDLALRADPRATSHGEAYEEVVTRLLGMAVSSAALFPPVKVAVSGMSPPPDEAVTSTVSALAEGFGRRLTAWASLLTCAMTHREHLTGVELAVFAEPYLKVCPEIERLLA